MTLAVSPAYRHGDCRQQTAAVYRHPYYKTHIKIRHYTDTHTVRQTKGQLLNWQYPNPHRYANRTTPTVSAYQKKGIWRAIAKDVRTLGVYDRQSTHSHKQWEDLRRWARKTAEAQLGMASQRGRGARRI
ncbi:hypothetical protein NDU88_001427 [Pleurodeles waltl]|uniref:Myb/SANT-like DNA-binding domain-containing protein n=1 Tax=Pleurodeles waltl TaxID=8319 RepID=A0AAV7MNP3_PLEWA|nr:hypothetical protein NDU88_001427 [Pleurodeles waltl]